ncbi:hypothetical protein SDC9_186234 [bioreactor metagenome]|uniref:Uncharacterized protein n=1 Tax=bioreactor metagenome TaxID=1076179 RepID=A0A645HKJ0_9ZZZZ
MSQPTTSPDPSHSPVATPSSGTITEPQSGTVDGNQIDPPGEIVATALI